MNLKVSKKYNVINLKILSKSESYEILKPPKTNSFFLSCFYFPSGLELTKSDGHQGGQLSEL